MSERRMSRRSRLERGDKPSEPERRRRQTMRRYEQFRTDLPKREYEEGEKDLDDTERSGARPEEFARPKGQKKTKEERNRVFAGGREKSIRPRVKRASK